MKRPAILLFLACLFVVSCNSEGARQTEENIEKWKKEIIETERKFTEMAQSEGIPAAFLADFAANIVE